MLLKLYVYGYMNRIQSSRRLERECHRNVELMWLTERLMPDFKTIADFRRDNKAAIGQVCVEFVGFCRELELFSDALVAIDGSKFKAVNSRDKNFTRHPLKDKCTTGNARRLKRWEHEHRLEAAAVELKKHPDAARLKKQIAEHPYGTIKHWMGQTHFLMKRLENVKTEMSLHVLAYNMRRAINLRGVPALVAALT